MVICETEHVYESSFNSEIAINYLVVTNCAGLLEINRAVLDLADRPFEFTLGVTCYGS